MRRQVEEKHSEGDEQFTVMTYRRKAGVTPHRRLTEAGEDDGANEEK